MSPRVLLAGADPGGGRLGARAHPWDGVSPFKIHYSITFKHQSITGRPPYPCEKSCILPWLGPLGTDLGPAGRSRALQNKTAARDQPGLRNTNQGLSGQIRIPLDASGPHRTDQGPAGQSRGARDESGPEEKIRAPMDESGPRQNE